MRMFLIELRKEKRAGAIPVLPAVGILGAFYAFANFIIILSTDWICSK